MSRVLVTGGAGFIGSHLVDALLEAGHEVVVLDDLSRGRRERVPAGVRLHEVDLRERQEVYRVLAEERPRWVSHQAAQVSVTASLRDPPFDLAVNVLGTAHLLEACVAVGVERCVLASSGGAISGEVPEGERAGEESPPRPENPYAISKLAAEQLLRVYRLHHGLVTTALRYSNVYGPGQTAEGEAGVVATFAERAAADGELLIFGRERAGDDGGIRDYVHVADVVRANLLALTAPEPPSVLNVATGIGTTTRELGRAIVALLGKGRLVDAPPRPGDVRRSVLDPTRFRALLGEPLPLLKGLESFLDAPSAAR